jgi:hypothetical protein
MKNSVSAVEPREDRAYAEHVNPRWAALLDILQMNVSYVLVGLPGGSRKCPCALPARAGFSMPALMARRATIR